MSEPQDVRIHIATGSVIKILLVLAGAGLLWYLRDIVLILLTAIVIASAMEPGVRGMQRHRLPRVLAVLIMYALVLAAFASVVFFFVPPILAEATSFLAHLPSAVQSLTTYTTNVTWAPSLSGLVTLISSATFLQNIESSITGSTGNLLSILSVFFGGVVSFGFVVIFSFYFSVQETGVDDFLRVITPSQYQEYVLGLWKRSQDKIGRWMQGQLLLGAIVGVLLFLGLTILQVPFALLLAVTAALCELIPVFGQILAMIPAVVLAFGAGGTTFALVVAALYVLVQQFEAHLIYPLVVRKIVGVPPLMVILALLIGGELAGFVGILLAVPIAAALREFISDIEKRRQTAQEVIK